MLGDAAQRIRGDIHRDVGSDETVFGGQGVIRCADSSQRRTIPLRVLSWCDKTDQSGGVPRFFKLLPWSLLCVGSVALTRAAPSAPQPSLNEVWEYAATSQPIAARNVLDDLDNLDARTKTLANLVLDMSRAPIPDGAWSDIEPALAKLAQGDDEVAARALYLQARMNQVQKSEPDYAKAEALYRELNRRWPGSHWAELGLVKLGMVKLFALWEPTNTEERFAEVETLLAQIHTSALRRDLQLQIGWAGVFYQRPLDKVLPHLIEADRLGGLMGITPEDLLVQIGELSYRAGHLEQAKTYFERFLREIPSSNKRYNVRMELEKVDAALAAQEGVR